MNGILYVEKTVQGKEKKATKPYPTIFLTFLFWNDYRFMAVIK